MMTRLAIWLRWRWDRRGCRQPIAYDVAGWAIPNSYSGHATQPTTRVR